MVVLQRHEPLIVSRLFIVNGPGVMTGGDKHQIVVHVSAETLRDAEAGRCEIENGAGVSAEAMRLCAITCSCCGWAA